MSTTLDHSPEPAGIDPRIRARRVAVLRQEGRRRLHRLVRLGGLAALLALAVGSVRTPMLDVDRIRVAGAAHTPELEILGALGVARGDPMVDIDEAEAGRRVEALPWVAEATVRRSWPGTVAVTVVEREAAATAAAHAGGWAVLDPSGRVLEVTPDRPAELIELAGVPGAGPPGTLVADRATAALDVARSLPSELAAVVAVVRAGEAGGVELELHDGGTVRLGPRAALAPALVAAATVVAEVGSPCVEVLDVRVPDVPALTRRPGCA